MDACCICKRPTGEKDIVCEQCSAGAHVACLENSVAPPGDWYCPACLFTFDGATAEDYDKWLQSHQLRNLVGQKGALLYKGKLRMGRFTFPTQDDYNQARAQATPGQVVAISIETPYWLSLIHI